MEIALAATAVIVLASMAVLVFGARRWRSTSRIFLERLRNPRPDVPPLVYDEQEIRGLPDPVVRFFRAVLRPGQPMVRQASVLQEGTIRLGESEGGWRPFTACQVYSVRPAGFLWDARVRLPLGLSVAVRDTYFAERGSLRAELLGLIPLAQGQGGPELAAGALQRHLAELAWIPTALLPSQGVQWSPIDDRRARARLTDGRTSVWLDFQFTANGEIEEIFTPARPRAAHGSYELAPWTGRFTAYGERHGMRIPLEGEVGWQIDGKYFCYWRGRIEEVVYQCASPVSTEALGGGERGPE